MKVTGRILLLWHILYVNWLTIQAGRGGKHVQRSRPKSDVKHKSYEPRNNFFSRRILDKYHPSSNGSINKNDKRAFIRRKIQIKGIPKAVVLTVNGRRIDTNGGSTTLPEQPLPAPLPARNNPINLHINLNKKPYDTNIAGQRKQPIIITRPNPQPMRPIVIPVPMPAQPPQPAPVVLPAPPPPPPPPPPVFPLPLPPYLPAPLPPPAPVPVPVPVPVPAPTPPSDKEDTDLGTILQTAALLNSLGKKEEKRPKIIPVPVMAYPPPYMGYPPNRNPNQGYQGYPARGNPNQGYPAGGNPNQGYPASENPNQGYPAAGNENQGYPGMGNENQGPSPNQGYDPNAIKKQAATPAAANTSPVAGLSGILPLLLPLNCRCGCERRCPDLCNLCKDVDEEIVDTLECCKTQPCPCGSPGAVTTQPAVVPATAGAAVAPAGTAVAPAVVPVAPQTQQGAALPAPASTTTQVQPLQQSFPSLQTTAPGQGVTPVQPASAPPLPQLTASAPPLPASAPPLPSIPASAPPLQPASAPPLPSLQLNPVSPSQTSPGPQSPGPAPQPLPSGPGTSPAPTGPVPLPGLPGPLPPKPEIVPPTPGKKPDINPPKPELPVAGSSGTVTPPKPEILPLSPGLPTPEGTGQGPVPSTGPKPEIQPPVPQIGEGKAPSPAGPGSSPPSPGDPPSSLVAPPPDTGGPIKLPSIPPLLPGESAPSEPPAGTQAPPLPQLPLLRKDHPASSSAPGPAPQVFIIKENSASTKDIEDNKSAEALDNLSDSFESAFSKALKSERRKARLHGEPHRGSLNQRERESLDLEDEMNENEEKEEDEERVQSYGGSRREFGDDDKREDTDIKEDISQQNDNDNDESDGNDNNNDDDNNDDNNDDNHDDNSDDNDDDKDDNDDDGNDNDDNDADTKADREPPYDLDQPRYSHSPSHFEENQYKETSRHRGKHRSQKPNKYIGFQRSGKNEDRYDENADRAYHSYGRSKNAFSDQYVGHQGFRSPHFFRDKRPILKTTNQERKLQENGFHSFHTPPVTHSFSHQRHKITHKSFNSPKRRLKSQHYPKGRSQHTTSHVKHEFTHLQDKAPGKIGRMHATDHHSHHEKHKNHQNNNLKAEMIPENEISEDAGSSGEGNEYSGDDKLAAQKLAELLSSSGNYEKDKSHLPEDKTYTDEENKTSLSTVQSFKPIIHKMFNKHKKIKSAKIVVQDASYSSGEESGENDNGDKYY